jgi:hypothetical protein
MRKPNANLIAAAGLVAGSCSALTGYAVVYIAAVFLGFDDDVMATVDSTAYEMAMSAAIALGFWGLLLGALLTYIKQHWASSLYALIPLAFPIIILMIAGGPGDAAVLVFLGIVTGLISRLAANLCTAIFE